MQLGLGISPTWTYGVAVPAFTPASISGLQLWLDASDGSTLFTDSAGTTPATADGDPVGCWKDKSGNAKNATQSDGTLKAKLTVAYKSGKNVVYCDGTDIMDIVSFPTMSAATIFCAFRPTYLSGIWDRYISWRLGNNTDDASTGASFIPLLRTINTQYVCSFVSGGPRGSSAWSDQTWGLWMARNDGTAFSAQKNADSLQSYTPSAFDRGAEVQIGGRRGAGGGNNLPNDFGKCNIAEIVWYNSALDDADAASVRSYLNAKWSIY